MTPERWEQVGGLYRVAVDLQPDERASFLDGACGDNESLRLEVESLLAAEDGAGDFLDAGAMKDAAKMLVGESSWMLVGKNLGHYHVLSLLGSGGMGEVYQVEDTRLKRKVALKLLPTELTANRDRLRRFEQEARAASALNHPNIITIHEIGEVDGVNFIVTELIEGQTLRRLMATARMQLSLVLDVAMQVASALTAAHAAGIIHRDLKPENIMLRPDGLIKVLDFGLAKLTESPTSNLKSEAPTVGRVDTEMGTVMGTAQYMSPEQARGLKVDARTDIFSLAVLIYEMVAGRLPFEGSNTNEIVASTLSDKEPAPLARYARELPAELERIVSKALRKDREERYQTIKDLLIDLRSLRAELEFQRRLERSTPPDSSRDEIVAANSPPVAVETAEQPVAPTAIREEKTAREHRTKGGARLWKTASSRTGLVVIAATVIVAFSGWFFWSRANVKWARAQLPRIEQLEQSQQYFEAYDLAIVAQKFLSDDATLTRLMPTISDNLSVTTEPAGAQVYLKRFVPEASRFPPVEFVGTTPISNLRIARGQYILYIEKDGYAKIERTLSGAIWHASKLTIMPPPLRIEQKLIAADKMPDRMTFIPGGDYRLVAWERPTDARVRLDDYFMDKYEVSNREYKEFINAGGYLKNQYWQYSFVKDGRALSWERAMKEFRDRTGLPAPRSWSNQNFPEGKAEHPVTDITWYEAAAYAAFRGKQLPTIFQWEKAARDGNVASATSYMPWGLFYPGDTLDQRANFNNNGTMPVSSSEFGLSPFGAYNMAGNVSEWCRNEMSGGFTATGGAWGEPEYTFAEYGAFPGFYSSNKLGFRCALNTPGATGDQGAWRIELKREIAVYAPASEPSFNDYLSYYRYNKTPLDPQIVEVQETAEWQREKITLNGADGERVIAYLYLPKNFPRPLQVINIVPAGDVEQGHRSLPASIEDILAPLIKSGRAVFGVITKGYIERLRPAGYEPPDPRTVEYREMIINRITDVRHGLDYLATRDDVDAHRIAFFGPSSGAHIGLILAAVEDRYASVILQGAGLRQAEVQTIAEANPINFAPHIRAPKLMAHGRYDEDIALKTEAEPLYKLLREPKRLVLFEGGHIPPNELFVPLMNGWLDETLGPVKRE